MAKEFAKVCRLEELADKSTLPIAAALDERIHKALEKSRQAATGLVFAEVTAGLCFCRIARSVPQSDWKYRSGVRNAHTALQMADKYMWKLGLSHPEFDQMMAQTERLKFELDSIKR